MKILSKLKDADLRGVAPPQNWTTLAVEEIERLQAENAQLERENAELRRDAAIGAVVWNFIDRMNDVAPECGDSAERILAEFVAAVMPEFNSAMERWRL